MERCGDITPVGIAHCITGEVRIFQRPRVYQRIRSNLIDALGNSSAVFMVLGLGGCSQESRFEARHREHRCTHAGEVEPAELTRAMDHVGVTRLQTHRTINSTAPKHGCAFGSTLPSSGYWQWIKVSQCFQLVQSHEARHCARFSHVVRSRPDLLYPSPLPHISSFPANAVSVLYATWDESRAWVDDRLGVVPRALAEGESH